MKRSSRSLIGILLVTVALALWNVQPIRAQAPTGVQLFTDVYQLITQEALAPPDSSVLLRAAVDGLRAGLRGQGLDLGRVAELTGHEQQDFSMVLGLVRQAMGLAPRGVNPMEAVYAAIK